MARKKPKSSPAMRQAPWLYTFADLMNLLLCFFIMIVAFSDINVNKFEQLSISIANSIGAKKNSTASDGMIDSGMSQIGGLEQYYSLLDQEATDEDTSSDQEEDPDQSGTATEKEELDEAIAKLEQKMEEETTVMYDEVSELADRYNLTDYVELSMDDQYKYVELTLKGSVLYASGDAKIKRAALPILNSIGNIINEFKGYGVEITGHTDNVPMSENSQYKDNNWLSSARALNAAQYLIEECGVDPAMLKYSGRGEYDPIASNATEEGRAKNRRIEIKIYNEYSTSQ